MHYRLRFLGPDGQVTRTLELGCRDDRRALAFLDDLASELACELWQGDRLVKQLTSLTCGVPLRRRAPAARRPGYGTATARGLAGAAPL